MLIDDPFPDGFDLQLIPILNASRTRMAFVDFSYADARLGHKRSERFKVMPADTDQTVRIGLPAGAVQTFDYKITIVPVSGAMQSTSITGATETLIAIAD